MADINTLIANLNETIRALSRADDISQQQLLLATQKAHDLLEELKKSAQGAKLEGLEKFLNRIQLILSQLHQVAQEPDPAKARNLTPPNEILQQLTDAYQQYAVPIVDSMKQSGIVHNNNAGTIASLGAEVFNSCRDINTYRPNMNRKETICAVLGTVLMFAGIGMLIAATVNPTTMPIVAGIAVITLGCYLAKKAIERHKNAQADKINQSLDEQLKQIDEISIASKVDKNQRQAIKFTEASACNLESPVAAVESKPNFIQQVGNAVTNFFKFHK